MNLVDQMLYHPEILESDFVLFTLRWGLNASFVKKALKASDDQKSRRIHVPSFSCSCVWSCNLYSLTEYDLRCVHQG